MEIALRRPVFAASPLQLGLFAVILFSLTPVGTRTAAIALGGPLTGGGRILGAGLLAATILIGTRAPWPTAAQWRGLLPVILGTGIGFPLLLSWALGHVDASHAAVVIGLAPLLTTVIGAIWDNERIPLRTLVATLVGTAAVLGEAWSASGGQWHGEDGMLLVAVLVVAIGYVGGGRLSRTMPGWQVTCWSVAAPLPFSIAWTIGIAACTPDLALRLSTAPWSAWLGLAWVAGISQVLGIFPWYAALARGGFARISPLQLLQPGLGVLAAWLLIHEQPRVTTILALVVVVAALAIGRRPTR